MATNDKQYNVLAMKGWDMTDEQMAELHGIDPSLVGTKQLNEAILMKGHQASMEEYMLKGDSEVTAKTKADKLTTKARKDIHMLYKSKNI